MPKEDFLSERQRAEDIVLGALGFGEDAEIITIDLTTTGYAGVGVWSDGEKFDFRYDEELDELEKWALKVLMD